MAVEYDKSFSKLADNYSCTYTSQEGGVRICFESVGSLAGRIGAFERAVRQGVRLSPLAVRVTEASDAQLYHARSPPE